MTRFDAVLLDMDGVLYHGERVLPGAVDFLRRIAHLRHAFITNNPRVPPAGVADRLARMGFERPDPCQIMTSAQAAALWLTKQKPDFRYFAVGDAGLHEALAQAGVADQDNADFVVVGEGPGLDFRSLTIGINLILQKGAVLVSTNPDHNVDATCAGQPCVEPGGGALVAPFATGANVVPVTIGKPEPLLFEMALEKLGVDPGDCLMVGDRPDTDIAGAAAIGMKTALVRTGRFRPGEAYPPDLPKPDFDVESLSELQTKEPLIKSGKNQAEIKVLRFAAK